VTYLNSSAEFSKDRVYRYKLARHISHGDRKILFVGLNPSTADETKDDATIRRCVAFSRKWGFNWYLMGNIYSYRSTDPKNLYTVDDPVDLIPNLCALGIMASEAEVVVAAWGNNLLTAEADLIANTILLLPHARCLGRNKNGSPKHPLYLHGDTELQPIRE
jgi:hypothetical protein